MSSVRTRTRGAARRRRSYTAAIPNGVSAGGYDETLPYRLVRRAGVGHAAPDFPRDLLIRLIDYPEMPPAMNAREVVKAGRTALVVRVKIPLGERMTSVAWKRVLPRSLGKRAANVFRPSGALRTWRLGHALLERGIATARPLAIVVPPRRRFGAPTYIAAEWVAGSRNLGEFAASLEGDSRQTRRRRVAAVACALGTLLGRMHAAGVSHRDLKAGNLLVTESGGAATPSIIDLDGAALSRRVSFRRRVKNLSRLAESADALGCATLSDRLRFLKAWIEASTEATAWKKTWKRIAKLTARRHARKGGPARGESM